MWQLIWWWRVPWPWAFGYWPRPYPREQIVFQYWHFGLFEVRRLKTHEEIERAYREADAVPQDAP